MSQNPSNHQTVRLICFVLSFLVCTQLTPGFTPLSNIQFCCCRFAGQTVQMGTYLSILCLPSINDKIICSMILIKQAHTDDIHPWWGTMCFNRYKTNWLLILGQITTWKTSEKVFSLNEKKVNILCKTLPEKL